MSLSDYSHIVFSPKTERAQQETTRISKLTDWALYKEYVRSGVEEISGSVGNKEDLERSSKELHNTIRRAYELSCPIKVKRSTSTNWWNKDLEELRTSVRKLFNEAKKARTLESV